jgi:ATP-dependent DNA helicase RecG
VLGTRQTGALQLRVADLLRDADLLPQVIEISEHLLAARPDDVEPLIARWVKGPVDYAKV